MNNDTPQIFGEDEHDYPADAGSFPEHDGEDFQAFRGWAGWGDRVEPVAPDDDYPPPSFSPYSYEPSSYEPEYPQRPGPGHPGYPQGPGYAPDSSYARRVGYPHDSQDGRNLGYAPDVGYAPEVSYLRDHGYSADLGFAEDPGYTGDLGFVRDAELVPLMEPLPDLQEALLPPSQAADPEYVRETSDGLTTESLLHGKRTAPGSGWRRSVYRATGGLLRFGESAAEMRRRDLVNRVRTPVAGGHHRVAVLSLKGGVGKTTTAVGLGATLATLRGDRVIAIDANPDRGTLSDKVRLETAATIRDLLNERDQVSRYADVRAFTSQAPSRLEVLASDRDPGVSVAFGADDYWDAARVLEHFYSICITDCGTGLLHSAMSGVLRLADQIILVSSPSVDGARSASATLDWLEAHNCGDLVRNGVVVLSAIRPKSKSTVDLDRLEHHFAARCRAVARIPYDPHLEEGAEIELELLGSETAEAYLALAAVVGDGLAWPRRLTSRPALP
jgi:MinD-like ATPase involved in chromosome partitioning or flagellar assembly